MDSDQRVTPEERVHCQHCRHFYITWDKSMPYGCKKIGFKSRIIPSLEVFRNSGSRCLHFEKKRRHS